MAKLMELRVVTPERVVFEGAARSLVAPAWDGWVGVLPGHAPFLTLLGSGPIEVDSEAGERQAFGISGGVMKVESNQVMVLADRVEPS
ncbi:MAG: ATP synthase F1 subunit epsilon [Gemmatimonadota bacterium]|nr:ATP synthase F1 subunit epsilon [Gemmatimonadota bacterium]MDE2865051.1 ATP synthase F1 subunit epsilon [Gemmatimonadota bacterium]MYB06568.1 ATP synthase F1 subunit epsilon [Gemmatimonadota bacterium]MYE15258.1 ATP synthase F1 subunit epsilon [Gemmatimonadota bacterium]MYG23889.1 ATP synthase F1 subunit epsilon [Gemmatimonadota bacterium]